MTLANLLWKIPTDFSMKYDFPEIFFLESYLQSERDIIVQLDSVLSSLVKGYKASEAAYVSSNASKKNNYSIDSPEFGLFRHFLESHTRFFLKFKEITGRLSEVQSKKTAPLIEKFNNSLKMINTDLSRLKSIINEPIEHLTSSRKNYEQLLSKLINTITSKKLSPNVLNQQLPRALSAVDTKLQRVQTLYLEFRTKFLEYCQSRDRVFQQAEELLNATALEIKKVIDDVATIDGDAIKQIVGEAEKKEINIDFNKVVEPQFWNKPSQKRKKGTFTVTVDRTIEVDSENKITPDDEYEIVDACGDEWQIKDKKGQVWNVPLEFLIPLQNI